MAQDQNKAPIRGEKSESSPAIQEWWPFANLHREIDRLFDDFRPMAASIRPSLRFRSAEAHEDGTDSSGGYYGDRGGIRTHGRLARSR